MRCTKYVVYMAVVKKDNTHAALDDYMDTD